MTVTPVLTSATQLAQAIASGKSPRLLDVRWNLFDPTAGKPNFLAGHIPGAVYADMETELSDHAKQGLGRHPLPDRESLQAAARAWGINDGDAVVVYDDRAGSAAARAWWLLRHAGVADVSILDGGLAAWTAAGEAVEQGEPRIVPGNVTLDWGRMPVVDADGAAAFPSHGTLLDARAGERYRGETEPLDPRAGHIPGALNAPTTDNVDTDGRFLPAEHLRERFAALGIGQGDAVAVYCGSGVTAAHEIAALAVAGIDAALFPGSWSQWSNEADRPVQVGP